MIENNYLWISIKKWFIINVHIVADQILVAEMLEDLEDLEDQLAEDLEMLKNLEDLFVEMLEDQRDLVEWLEDEVQRK